MRSYEQLRLHTENSLKAVRGKLLPFIMSRYRAFKKPWLIGCGIALRSTPAAVAPAARVVWDANDNPAADASVRGVSQPTRRKATHVSSAAEVIAVARHTDAPIQRLSPHALSSGQSSCIVLAAAGACNAELAGVTAASALPPRGSKPIVTDAASAGALDKTIVAIVISLQ